MLRRRVDEAAVGEGGGAVQARKGKADGARRRGLGWVMMPVLPVSCGWVRSWMVGFSRV